MQLKDLALRASELGLISSKKFDARNNIQSKSGLSSTLKAEYSCPTCSCGV